MCLPSQCPFGGSGPCVGLSGNGNTICQEFWDEDSQTCGEGFALCGDACKECRSSRGPCKFYVAIGGQTLLGDTEPTTPTTVADTEPTDSPEILCNGQRDPPEMCDNVPNREFCSFGTLETDCPVLCDSCPEPTTPTTVADTEPTTTISTTTTTTTLSTFDNKTWDQTMPWDCKPDGATLYNGRNAATASGTPPSDACAAKYPADWFVTEQDIDSLCGNPMDCLGNPTEGEYAGCLLVASRFSDSKPATVGVANKFCGNTASLGLDVEAGKFAVTYPAKGTPSDPAGRCSILDELFGGTRDEPSTVYIYCGTKDARPTTTTTTSTTVADTEPTTSTTPTAVGDTEPTTPTTVADTEQTTTATTTQTATLWTTQTSTAITTPMSSTATSTTSTWTRTTTTYTATTTTLRPGANEYPFGLVQQLRAACSGELEFAYIATPLRNNNPLQDRFHVFAKDARRIGCKNSGGSTFRSYVVDVDRDNRFQPDPFSSAPEPILAKCGSSNAGPDPNTGRQQLQTAAMSWPSYGNRDEPQQRGAKVGWLVASAVQCKPLVCPRGEYIDETENQCAECAPKLPCTAGEYIVGECKGAVNTLECIACTAPGSTNDLCPNKDATHMQYRIGSCKAELYGNKYRCTDQPSCTEGTLLSNYTAITKGLCVECPRSSCRPSQFRAGTCSGVENAYKCKECRKSKPKCARSLGHEEYLAGGCGSPVGGGDGGSNNYTCTACGNQACGVFEYRDGKCTTSSKQFSCMPQPVCKPGEFYKAGKDQGVGGNDGKILPGKATCRACPKGSFRKESGRERSCIQHAPVCDISDGITFEALAPSKMSDRVCATSAKCNDFEFESKPLQHGGAGSSSSGGQRECTALTTCVAGQYVAKDATETTDRTCKDCWLDAPAAVGSNDALVVQGFQFSDAANAKTCTAMSFCGANEYVKVLGGETHDLECAPNGRGNGNSTITVTIVVAVVVVLLVLGAARMTASKNGGGEGGTSSISYSFENPMYQNNTGQAIAGAGWNGSTLDDYSSSGDSSDGDGDATTGYEDVFGADTGGFGVEQAFGATSGYADITGGGAADDQSFGFGATAGYVDVSGAGMGAGVGIRTGAGRGAIANGVYSDVAGAGGVYIDVGAAATSGYAEVETAISRESSSDSDEEV
eukprot:gene9265-1046_t